MTFIIRQIIKRSVGDDIIRDRQVGTKTVTVGRATHHDIFLSDLRVGLDHLTITLNGSRLNVEADKGQTFVLGGRNQRKLALNRNQTATIEVGPFGLTFDQNPDGLWLIVIERIEPEEALGEEDVDDIFTLRGTLLAKRTPAWLGYLAVIFLFLAAPVAWFYGTLPGSVNEVTDLDRPWLSGDLAGDHANLEGECEACHVKAFSHVEDSACIECHDNLGNHADPVRLAGAMTILAGFDGVMASTNSFFGKDQGECADCHREHNGDEGMILQASSLCTDCHVDMATRIDTALGDAGSFSKLHPDFHATVVETPGDDPVFRRVALGTPEAMDNSGLKFPHDLHLLSDGGAARQAQDLGAEYGFGDALVCEDCHTKEKGGLLFDQVEMEANCQMCHNLDLPDPTYDRELPHGKPQEVVAAVRQYYKTRTLTELLETDSYMRRRPGDARRVRPQPRRETAVEDSDTIADDQVAMIFAEKGACGICHDVVPAPPGTVDFDIVPVTLVDKFMTNAEFDHESHETSDLTCESCHEARWSDRASDVLLPQIETVAGLPGGEDVTGCRDCHGDEKARAPMVKSACVSCHGYHDGTHAPLMTASVDDLGDTPGQLAFRPARWGRISEPASIR